MDWSLLLVLQVMFQPSLTVLFTVRAGQDVYASELGGNVVLGCSFQPKLSTPLTDLKVGWHRFVAGKPQDVYRMVNGMELLESQDPEFQDRVRLLTDELENGWAKLQISKLRLSDSGEYQCLVQTSEGADYKRVVLSVQAPYRVVLKQIQKAAEGDEVLLTCQSEGYPKSSVTWKDGNMQRIDAYETLEQTAEQLLKVTSQIRVPSSDKKNYTCSFNNTNVFATFHIPDEIAVPDANSNALITALCIVGVLVATVIAVLLYRRQKGHRNNSTRNLLVNRRGKPFLPDFCLQINKDSEEEIAVINKGSLEENLRVFLKDRYLELPFTEMPRIYWETWGVEVLPHRLQNNHGQPVTLQALLPEAGEMLLLEGPSGSGKTILARILISSWTEGPKHAFPNLLDLSAVQLLFYMDCSQVKGDLFKEVTTQLSITEKLTTEDSLRTLLSHSSETLLLLDGYKEGDQDFDESVKRFLREREGCRVLIMACQEHCNALREIIGPGRVLELQMETV